MTRDRARHLCIENLALKLYQSVECKLKDRAKQDWNTAANYIDAHPEIVDVVAQTCWPDSFDSTAFEHTYGEHIWNQAFKPLICEQGGLQRPPYGRVLYGE
jgi:hypothetical protein